MPAAAQDAPFRLVVDNLTKAFGRHRICRKMCWEMTTGETVAIVGPNGSGKSTLVKMIAGLIRPDAGHIRHWHGGTERRRADWYRHVGMVSPELALYDELSARENLQFANRVGRWRKTSDGIEAVLREFGLGDRGDDRVGTFSSGMKQRLKLAAALLKDPQLLLLDEPTITLDTEGTERLWAALGARSVAAIIATNDPAEAAGATRRVVMGMDGPGVAHA